MITFEETQIEIGCTRRGRPSYRRAPALYVIVDGAKLYPPMRIRDAKRFAKQIQKTPKP